ncbi:bifunctional RNase H/acid phosphatase [Mycobacteroides chelonae]|uniref:Bifunctional RNase H/acid phosphatase n=1 Tax=Mycobacteroides chelonae TaxID=1774 RepID=A0A1S1MAY3_MYCCH|nr:bifunctional RNase H/acid phosphatase [Mycobacteroides chelonae]OHU80406.1 bifunctional RNase H/acid phosphatase [Mycobacteroides chelonae]QQG87436.1 bifunctional RNase H/acid phosphatase [Mycobacteroides chelonae]QQG92251.1 bifunctional RNase H/acid phosphatase [Mycobacteroides chelonae]
MRVLVEADGGSRGNPGLAGYGAVVFAPDHETVLGEACEAIGHATNNVAEYRGLIAGLAEAARLGATEVSVSMDSKLVVEQMSGRWKVKHPDLITLYQQAVTAAMQFESVSYRWIPRERNKHADRLANEAMDRASGIEPKAPKKPKEPKESNETKAADAAPGWTGARGKPTRMLLLRHGQTELSVQRRYSGRGNPELTALGREQAANAARYLASRGGIAAVVSSPLGRAKETAAAAADALGVPLTVDDDLIETDFGKWEGLTFSEASERDPELHAQWLSDTSVTPPEGESFDTVHHRVRRARNRIIAEYGGATVLVVSHVTPIKTLLRLALDAGPSLLYRLHLDLASLSIAEFYSDGPASVRLVNETSYLT